MQLMVRAPNTFGSLEWVDHASDCALGSPPDARSVGTGSRYAEALLLSEKRRLEVLEDPTNFGLAGPLLHLAEVPVRAVHPLPRYGASPKPFPIELCDQRVDGFAEHCLPMSDDVRHRMVARLAVRHVATVRPLPDRRPGITRRRQRTHPPRSLGCPEGRRNA